MSAAREDDLVVVEASGPTTVWRIRIRSVNIHHFDLLPGAGMRGPDDQ